MGGVQQIDGTARGTARGAGNVAICRAALVKPTAFGDRLREFLAQHQPHLEEVTADQQVMHTPLWR